MENPVSIPENIESHGWQFQYVFDAEGVRPNFAYSIGFVESYSHPEVMIFGLSKEVMHTLLSNIAYDLKEGKKFHVDKKIEGILNGGLSVMFKQMQESALPEYAGIALDYYGKSVPMLVLLWPDKNNILPTEVGCDLTVQDEAVNVV
jgi:hypothetical protein